MKSSGTKHGGSKSTKTKSKPQTTGTSFISQTFNNLVHPTIQFDTGQWLGPFTVVINTKGLKHATLGGEVDTALNNCYDEQTDVVATLDTLVDYSIPSGSIIELGATSDLKGRFSRIDAITAGSLYAGVLHSPEDTPSLASICDPSDEEILAQFAPTTDPDALCSTPLNYPTDPITQPDPKLPQLPNLLSDNVLYISPQIAAQLGYMPSDYSHLPIDQLVCNNHTHTCSHPAQFNKTQTDFAQHKHQQEYSDDQLLTLQFPLEKRIYIRIAQLPGVIEQQTSDKQPQPLFPTISNPLNITDTTNELRIAQSGIFYLLPAMNNFPLNVVSDILKRYLSTPLKHQVNPYVRGRRMHVGMVIAVPITIQEEDRLYHQSIEEKAEDHDEENLKNIPDQHFPVDCLYFYVAQLECDKNVYTATDEHKNTLYEEEMEANSGAHNNFLTCSLQRTITSSLQSARALVGLSSLDSTDKKGYTKNRYKNIDESVETMEVHRTTSYMLISSEKTEITVHAFNLSCLRPSLYQHLYSTYVANTYNYTTLVQLALKHALLCSIPSPTSPTSPTSISSISSTTEDTQLIENRSDKVFSPNGQLITTDNIEIDPRAKFNSLLALIRKHPSLLFNIPILDTLLIRGYGVAFTKLLDSILPALYSSHTFILPLIQSTHSKNSKATLLRALSYLMHLDYLETDTDQVKGLITEGEIQYLSSALSCIVNIRNIGVDTIIPPLPGRTPGIVNNIYVLTASCADIPKHVLATDVIDLPLPAPTPRARMYLFELLSRMTFNSMRYDQNPIPQSLQSSPTSSSSSSFHQSTITYGLNKAKYSRTRIVTNDISCNQLSALLVCSYVGLTGYTNAPTQSISLLAQAILVKSINTYRTDKDMYQTCLTKRQDLLLTCHCHVLNSTLQHNNVASGIPNVSWKDIGAAGTIRKELMQLIKPKSSSSSTQALGNAFSLQRRGVLLYGPPGSGKTLVAKALAGESGIGFVTANAGEILSMYIGESEKKIRDLFINARNSAPCVLFLDEIDSLAPSKTNAGDSGGGGVMQRIVSQLLLEIDALNDDGIDVFLVGATNRPELLDLSLLRPGRLDRSIYVGISSTVDDQLQILTALTRKFTLGPKVNLRKIVEAYCISRPLTGADFFALASTSMTLAIMDAVNNVEREKNGEVVNQDDDDYDVENDPDPFVPKKSVSDTVGDLNTFTSNSSLINKTLSASGMTGMTATDASSHATTTAAPASTLSSSLTVSDALSFDTMGLDGMAPKSTKKKIDLFSFGKEPAKGTTMTPVPISAPNSTTPDTSTTVTSPVAPRRKKKGGIDGILDFGLPTGIDITSAPAPTPPTDKPAEPDPTPTDANVAAVTAPEQTEPVKRKKKKAVGMDLLGIPGLDFTPLPPPPQAVSEVAPQDLQPVDNQVVNQRDQDQGQSTSDTITPPLPINADATSNIPESTSQPAPAPAKKGRKKKVDQFSLLGDLGIDFSASLQDVAQSATTTSTNQPAVDTTTTIPTPPETVAVEAHSDSLVESVAPTELPLRSVKELHPETVPIEEQPTEPIVIDDAQASAESQLEIEPTQPTQTETETTLDFETTPVEMERQDEIEVDAPDSSTPQPPSSTSSTSTFGKKFTLPKGRGGFNLKLKKQLMNSLAKQATISLPTASDQSPQTISDPLENGNSRGVSVEIVDGEEHDNTKAPTLNKPLNVSKNSSTAKGNQQLLAQLFAGSKKGRVNKKGSKGKKVEDEIAQDIEEEEEEEEEGGSLDEDEDMEVYDEDGEILDEDDEDGEIDGEYEDDNFELSDDDDQYIPAPAYAGIQLSLLWGSIKDGKKAQRSQNGQESETSDEKAKATDQVDPNQFIFDDESEESDIDYESDDDNDEFIEAYECVEFSDDDGESPPLPSQSTTKPLLSQEIEALAAEKRAQIAQSVASRGVVVYQKHFIQAAKKLTPSLSAQELDHYKKIREQFSSKRAKKQV